MEFDKPPSQSGGYAWPGADEAAVTLSCARVARHIARSGVRRVGVLPVGRYGLGWSGLDLSPMLERVAGALAMFVDGDVAFIGPWTEWSVRAPAGSAAAAHTREVHPHVLEVVPRPQEDGASAAAALEPALSSVPVTVSPILVDLGGYGRLEAIPAAVAALDGLLIAVVARSARTNRVAEALKDVVPAAKRLGAILIG